MEPPLPTIVAILIGHNLEETAFEVQKVFAKFNQGLEQSYLMPFVTDGGWYTAGGKLLPSCGPKIHYIYALCVALTCVLIALPSHNSHS